MRTLHYTLEDAKQWAAFSGDYNPIHFDLEWVKAKGGEHLSVHGMRTLLDVKQFASEQFVSQEDSDAAFIKCTVRLRHPLWNGKNYHLVARNKAGSVALLAADDQQNCLTCHLSKVEHFPFDEIQLVEGLSSANVTQRQSTFPVFSQGIYEWQFIDAVLFGFLINNDSLLKQEDMQKWLPEGATLKDIFRHYPIVQTHQEVIFDREFLKKWTPLDEPQPLYIQILPALVIGDKDNGLLIRISIVASYKNKLINNSITLKVSSITK